MTTLIIFAKIPDSGKVKTRLGHKIGMKFSSELYTCFLKDAVAQFKLLKDCRPVWYLANEPTQFQEFESTINSGFPIFAQKGTDLGEKMMTAIYEQRENGSFMVIGTDHPSLPTSYIQKGIDELHDNRQKMVIGPSLDGGFYTIGMNTWIPEAFLGMTYSHSDVYRQTVANVRSTQKTIVELPMWYDIDELADLQKLAMELKHSNQLEYEPLHTRHWLKINEKLLEERI